jgi:hypothetical protein
MPAIWLEVTELLSAARAYPDSRYGGFDRLSKKRDIKRVHLKSDS